MSVLGSAKVRIDGDAKGAMAALDDAGDAAERLKRRLNDARSSASDMAGGMLRAEAIMGGLRAAVAGAGAATAAYAAENVAVADAFTVVSERGTALAASMAGLALGQGGAEQSSAAAAVAYVNGYSPDLKASDGVAAKERATGFKEKQGVSDNGSSLGELMKTVRELGGIGHTQRNIELSYRVQRQVDVKGYVLTGMFRVQPVIDFNVVWID